MLVGSILTLATLPKLEKCKEEVDRLQAIVGSANVPNEKNFYVRRIPTEVPFLFVWRVHVPEGRQICLEYSTVSGSSAVAKPKRLQRHGDMILRFELRQEGGMVMEFSHTNRGLGRSRRTMKGLDAFFESIDRHRIYVAGTDSTEEFAPTEVVELLNMEAGEELLDETEREHGIAARRLFERPTYFRIGFPEAFKNSNLESQDDETTESE